MKKILIASMVLISIQFGNAHERDDIQQVLKELTYIKEVTQQLKKKYGNGNGKIRFNYDALIEQLNVIEYGTKQYLNYKVEELHTTPPKALVSPTYKVRKN